MSKLMTDYEYVNKEGWVGPCGHENFEGKENIKTEGTSAYQVVECLDCGVTWIDRYQLVGYEDLTFPEKEKK